MDIGKLLLIIGSLMALTGLILTYLPGLFSWFGKLPGDIKIQNEHSFVFIPLTSMLVVSGLISLIINLFFRK